MRDMVIGTCSICGGRVMQYSVLHIVGPFPPAECESCGATERQGGTFIEMEPKRHVTTTRTASNNYPLNPGARCSSGCGYCGRCD